jgi:predicted LPLAT superfamily acyltransferase
VPTPEVDPIDAPKRQRWTGRTIGGAILFGTCVKLLPLAGLRGTWLVAWGIAAVFFALGGRHWFGTRQYWRRLRPRAGIGLHMILAYRQMASFGRILCDRMLAYLRPDLYQITPIGLDGMRALRQQKKGCLLISAHVGNWEMSSYWLNTIAGNIGKVHVVMVRDDAEFVQRYGDERLRGTFTNVIDPRDGLGASLAINNALKDGDMVCMLADRVFGEQPAVTVKFMGGEVRMPLGPFQAAAVTGAPILVGFLVKTGFSSYVVQVDEPWYVQLPSRRGDRTAALQRAVQRWAKRLELQVRRNPMQWHNFYNYWAD